MFVWTFLLRITHTIISQINADSSWITLYIDCSESDGAGLRSDAGDQSPVPWHGPFPGLDCLAVKLFLSVGLYVKLKVFKLETCKEILLVYYSLLVSFSNSTSWGGGILAFFIDEPRIHLNEKCSGRQRRDAIKYIAISWSKLPFRRTHEETG